MAALQFPPEVTGQNTGTQYTGSNGVAYIWDGYKWVGHSPTLAPGSNSISNNGNVVQVDQSGNLHLPNYTLPVNGGTFGQSLTWPSSGTTLAWTTATGSGSGVTDRLVSNGQEVVLTGGDSKLHIPGYLLTPYGALRSNSLDNGLSVDAFPSQSVSITSNGTLHKWNFGVDGNLTLPTGYSIGGNTNGNDGIALTTDRGTVLFGNHPECVPTSGSHFHIMRDDPANVDLFFGDDFDYVKLPSIPNGNGVEIGAGEGNYTWLFGSDGNLTFPGGTLSIQPTGDGNPLGNIISSGDAPLVTFSAGTSTYSQMFWVEDITNSSTNLSEIKADRHGVRIGTGALQQNGFSFQGSNSWQFDSTGTLTLPETNKITAYVPTSGHKLTGLPNPTEQVDITTYRWPTYDSTVQELIYGSLHFGEGWVVYPESDPTARVTVTHFSVNLVPPSYLEITFSDTLGDGPYVVLSPDYVEERSSPITIGNNETNWIFGTDSTTTFPNNTLDAGTSTITIKSTINAELEYFNDNFQELPNEVGNAFVGVDSSGPYMANLALNSSGTDANLSTWSVDSNGNLVTEIFHEISTSTDVGDIVDIDGNSIIYTIASETPPTRAPAGRLWYNSVEGRMYIRYEDLWVDASPTVVPPPSTYLGGLTVEGTSISPVDSTGTVSIQTGVSNQWTFGLDGVTTLPNGQLDFNAPYSRFKDSVNTGVQLGSPDDQNYVNVDNTAVTVQVNSDGAAGPHALDQYNWTFGTDGSLTLPPGSTSTIQSGQIFSQVNSGFLNLDVQFNSDVYGGVRMGTAANRPVDIVTNFEISPNVWRFGTDSTLTLPTGGEILDISGLGPGLSTGFIDPNGITVGTAPGNDITFTPSDGVGLYSNSNLWQFGTDGTTTLPGPINNILVGTTSTNGSGDPAYPTALNLTKTVNKLSDNTGSTYTLADGVEGQIMYLIPQNGTTIGGVNITVNHGRVLNGTTAMTATVVTNVSFAPFNFPGTPMPNVGVTTLIFTDGAWQADAGVWDY